MRSTFKNVAWTSLSTITTFCVQIGVIGFLTNYLTASEFGKISILLVVYGLFQLFSGLGMTNYIISQKDISKPELNNIFFLNVTFSFFVFFVIYLTSSIIEDFFQAENLSFLIDQLSISFIFLPISVFFSNVLRRELAFNLIAKIEVLSRVLWGVLITTLAFLGYGSQSFVIASILQVLASSFFFCIYGFRYYKPTFLFDIISLKGIVQYGLYQMGEALLGYFSKEADKIIIGKILGVTVLGVYSVFRDISFRLGNMIAFTFNRVYFPALSKQRDHKKFFTEDYISYLGVLVLSLGVAYSSLYISRDIVVGTIVNGEFQQYAYLIPLFCAFYFLRFSTAQISTVWLAKHRADIGFKWNILMFLVNPIVIYFLAHKGLENLLVGLTFIQISWIVLSYTVIHKLVGVGFFDYIKPIFGLMMLMILTYLVTRQYSLMISYREFGLNFIEVIGMFMLICIYIFLIDKNMGRLILKKVSEIRNTG